MIDIIQHTAPIIKKLENHPLTHSLLSIDDLKVFMEHHIYAVWDFMNIVKSLQNVLAPSNLPWTPPQNTNTARFIHEIVLVEESDEHPNGGYSSHFSMYYDSMKEIGAQTDAVYDWVFQNNPRGIPKIAQNFLEKNHSIIATKQTHKIASMFYFAREKIIPTLFQGFLNQNQELEEKAPIFFHYIKRHIEIDGDEHGDLAFDILKNCCQQDQRLWEEANDAALFALQARLQLWDDIIEKIKKE